MVKKKNTAIVLAAGQGKRMNSNVQKQFLELKGYPVLYYSLAEFEKSDFIDEIILVTGADLIEYCKKEIVEKYNFNKITQIVAGGKERYDSVYAGLQACENTEYVFIHDGARPFISKEILEKAYFNVKRTGACVVGMPSKDTVKIVDEEGKVKVTPDRKSVWIIQTPQVFEYGLIRNAHECIRKGDMSQVTDDAMIVETETDIKVQMSEGSYMNIKITTPEDLVIAEAFLNNK